ncbi:MAG: aminopeptidase [Actinomycetota bacterium]|nr:aminopeptidase [Actinomycetota bacterium]
MPDPRVERYAELLVDTCVGVQDGWQVVVTGSPLARPLLEAIARLLGERGAYAIVRVNLSGAFGLPDLQWVLAAPEARLGELAPIDRHMFENADAIVSVYAPENARDASAVSEKRLQLVHQASRPVLDRIVTGGLPWVGCQYPCPSLAQEAEMSVREFEDFLYGAVLLDWDEERRKMEKVAARFDAAEEVRIVGAGTDLRLSLAGRRGEVDAGGANMPGGEVFYSPVEDSAEGTIAFTEFPALYAGRSVEGIRFRFEGGRIVDASADRHEEFLLETLDADEGARRLGELGIGCNPGITRHMRNALFDEKMYGTVHLAIGSGFPYLGGTNESSVHWDIVKDLRDGGELYCDGELVQRGGEWRF